MLSIAIDLCKNILDFLLKKQEITEQSKDRISVVLSEISLILEDTANKLKNDEYPHFNCAVLERLSNNLHLQLIDFVDPLQLDEFHKILLQSSNIEKEFAQRKDPNTIESLLKASGDFKALSLIIKI